MLAIGIIVYLVAFSVPPVQCECCCWCYALLTYACRVPCPVNSVGDLLKFCGGVGDCNAACCNCDGGCLKDASAAYPFTGAANNSVDSKGRFAEFDSNADGFVTMSEMFSLLETMDVVGRLPAGYNSAETHFKRLDDDGDGQVSWDEFEKHA